MNFNLKYTVLLFFLTFTFLSCKKENTLVTDNQTTHIAIEFYNPNPLNIDLNSYKPSLKGKIKSEFPLTGYSAILLNNGNEISLSDIKLASGITEYEFELHIPYQLISDSVLIKATNSENQTKKASIALNMQQLPNINPSPIENKDAFAGAEGFGRYTTGGRGGKILFVTNLNDDNNQGSLRWAINQTGTRTIVFRVSGTILLTSPLEITNGNLTIAGQSAPGDGICLAKNNVVLKDNLQNVIIRYIRFRNAKGTGEYDAIWGRNCSNIILDHCSFSWGNDEVASFYDNTNFTMQWCIISESFYSSTHPKGNHGYGGIWGGYGASFHHNLIAHHTSRNPRFCGARYHIETRDQEIVDFRNNVIYNWGDNSIYGGEYGQQNMVNNYFKSGPATQLSKKNRIVEITDADSKWYISGNYVNGFQSITADNWSGGVQGASSGTSVRAYTAFGEANIQTQTSEEAFDAVLNRAGSSFVRDAIDTRLTNEVKNATTTYQGIYGPGIIDSELDTEGFPELKTYNELNDFDFDGMPDEWELQNGLDPKNNNDHKDFKLNTNYTNIEVYLNNLVIDKK